MKELLHNIQWSPREKSSVFGEPFAVADILSVLIPIMGIFAIVATIGIAWVIFRDAQERGISEANAKTWGLGVAFLLPIVAPIYFVLVVRSRSRETAVTDRERWVIWFSFTYVFSIIVTVIATPPDPFTQTLSLLVVMPLVALGTYIILIKNNIWLSSDKPT